MENVFLGIGSYVGDRVQFLAGAVRKIREIPETRIVKVSSVYETEPVGVKSQDAFLNAVVWIQTPMALTVFHSRMKMIEKEIGRVERFRWGPREIDIDVLMYGDHVINGSAIVVPHKEMVNRKFVLKPFAEISPETIHPSEHKTIKELLAVCNDTNAVDVSAEMTRSLSITLQE